MSGNKMYLFGRCGRPAAVRCLVIRCICLVGVVDQQLLDAW